MKSLKFLSSFLEKVMLQSEKEFQHPDKDEGLKKSLMSIKEKEEMHLPLNIYQKHN